MILILTALGLGFIIARFNLLPKSWYGKVEKLGSIALLLLLFSMGISLGVQPEIVSSLPSLGWKAIILSLGAILGSICFVWLVFKTRCEK